MRARAALLLFAAGGLFAANVSSTEYLDIIKYLASPEMRGRATGSPELEKAAAYIRDQFRGMNLKPLSGVSYYQDFDVTTSARLGQRNSLTYTTGEKPQALRIQDDFIPLNLSGTGDVSGSLVFAGFGITAPEYNYDDYAGLDVKGKIVVVAASRASGVRRQKRLRRQGLHRPLANLQQSGQCENPRRRRGPDGERRWRAFRRCRRSREIRRARPAPTTRASSSCKLKAAVVNKWLAPTGKRSQGIEADIDKTLQPESFALPQTLRLDHGYRHRARSENSPQRRRLPAG